ncbi:hypothetical protein PhCBS80983_g06309 [Powellomyces hirtus]|uniref:Uncharacterized protein n=1 Tax=Powellomyces hirtus TaxID=109895 RepID=A0A507DQX7_9FUNG|nr:hypothetical protein PhCBS80983_g06309 [Powellomyces hirtus]
MESILTELVDVLRSNNSPEQTRHDNETVEREVFWSEKIKHAEARTPTGYFAKPVFQKFRGFGRVETQFVNNPYYLEVPNAPTGYLRDADERSLNPDTFTRVFSDSDLRRMCKGQTRHRAPQSEQETRYLIRKGSSGYSRESDLHQRLAELREGQSRCMNEHLGPNAEERIFAKRQGKTTLEALPVDIFTDVDKHIKSSPNIKSKVKIPSPISDNEYGTPAWGGSPSQGGSGRTPEQLLQDTPIDRYLIPGVSPDGKKTVVNPKTGITIMKTNRAYKKMVDGFVMNGNRPPSLKDMPSKKAQPKEEVIVSDESDYVKALVNKYAASKKPQEDAKQPEESEQPAKKKRGGSPKQIERLKGAKEKAAIVRKQLAEKRHREEAEQKEKDEQNRIVKEAMRLRELEKESKKVKKQVIKKAKKVVKSLSEEEEEVIVRKKLKKKKGCLH